MEKRLISSYDEVNDTFVGKVDGETGYCADYGISDGIFLGINDSRIPTYVFVPNASEVFNIPKRILESANVKIAISCDDVFLSFNMCIDDLKICSVKCKNHFGMPNLNYLMDCNMQNIDVAPTLSRFIIYFFLFFAIDKLLNMSLFKTII